ncbi:hypothetical protein K7432_008977 [Basidiobolus ranarum]|uniref:Uncharacterized protein n=1 Tax=Basidiobolus ranarum TaxID=34480 RepID=A0ABR2VY48_9FUNG
MRPFYDVLAHLCLDTFEPISTTATFGLDMATDATLTGLFMIKIFQHVSQIRKIQRPLPANHSIEASSQSYISEQDISMHHLFKEYLYQAVPTLIFSFTLNAIIVSNIFQDYTLIVVYTDLIIQLRLANDLLVLNRLSVGANNIHTINDPQTNELRGAYDAETPVSNPNLQYKVHFDEDINLNKKALVGNVNLNEDSIESYELNKQSQSSTDRQNCAISRRTEQTFPSA